MILACILASSCKPRNHPDLSASAIKDSDEADDQIELSGPGRPIIIVSGWGGRHVDYSAFLGFLSSAGVSPDRVSVIYYHYLDSFENSVTDIQGQLRGLLEGKYQSDPKVDVFGVSTGHFVGLYALMTAGLAGRVQKYVGIVGVGHGITEAHIPILAGLEIPCPSVACGGTLSHLSPLGGNNPLIASFYRTYHSQIDALDKCSIFAKTSSPQASDGVITPADSGRFDGPYDTPALGGPFSPERVTTVAVPGMTHLSSITDRRYFVDLVRHCYGNEWRLPSDWSD